MEIKDLAPWIAVAITLALSILVPLFTQIANNRFKLKLNKEEKEYQKNRDLAEQKRLAYEEFLDKAGKCVVYFNEKNMQDITASAHKLYLYCPTKLWHMIEEFCSLNSQRQWDKANEVLVKLSKELSKDLNNIGMDKEQYDQL